MVTKNENKTAGSRHSPADCSATDTRYEKAVMDESFNRMANHPDCQPQIIAKHYTSQAMQAKDLLDMVEMKRNAIGATPALDKTIQEIMDSIKRAHQFSFGIKLEWPNKQ